MGKFRLTTDHPASRDGVPVLVGKAGEAYGPNDVVPLGMLAGRACDVVRHLAKHNGFSPDLMARFESAGGTDPRLATVYAMIGAGMGTLLD